MKPDGTPINGVTIQAFLAETAAESKGLEIYAANEAVSTTSNTSGDWSLSLWANTNGVTNTKYTFLITFKQGTPAIRYNLEVPNETEVLFSDLMINYSSQARDAELYNTEAAQYDFTITQGNSVRRKFEIVDSSNQPTDLTGWSARMMLKDKTGPWSLILNPTIDALQGQINLHLTGAQSNGFANKAIIYELTLFNAQDTIKLLYGNITVTPSFLIINGSA